MAPLQALLVGVDHYRHRPLQGAVHDVDAMEAFLCGRLGVPAEAVRKLVEPLGERPVGAGRPTFDALVAELRALGERAVTTGTRHVLFHYSGHGGRLPTVFPELKGELGHDECLVPPDAGTSDEPAGRCLRDVELFWLLRELIDRGLEVTVVLDCCHSGGIGYDPLRGRTPRWVENPAEAAGPSEPVAAPADLVAAWRTAGGDVLRHVGARALPGAERVVVLAACAADEVAYEERLGGRIHGLLSYLLLEALREGGEVLTYRRLQARLLAAARTGARRQTPEVSGPLDRLVLGLDELPTRRGVPILGRDGRGAGVRVAAGSLHGLSRGARLAVHAADAAPEAPPHGELVLEEVGAAESRGRPTRRDPEREVRIGDRATVISPGDWSCPTAILRAGDRAVPEPLASRLERAIRELSGFARLADPTEDAVLRVGRLDDTVALVDARGEPLPNLGSPLPEADPETPKRLLGLLDPVARWHFVRALAAPAGEAVFVDCLELRLERLDGGSGSSVAPLVGGSVGPWDPEEPLEIGASIRLTVTNHASRPLHGALLDLQPDWGISQAFPDELRGQTWRFEPGVERSVDLRICLPGEIDEGRDVLKVVAAPVPTSFRHFEQPAPVREPLRGGGRRSGGHPRLATAEVEVTVRRRLRG